MNHAIGDRVRSLIQLLTDQSICGDTTCKDLPIGALGTVTDVFASGGYGVLFDQDVHQLSCHMGPDDIGIWHGHDDPSCAYVGGISNRCTCQRETTP
jgi:hypothetical protein